jgi:hypothetical protein
LLAYLDFLEDMLERRHPGRAVVKRAEPVDATIPASLKKLPFVKKQLERDK